MQSANIRLYRLQYYVVIYIMNSNFLGKPQPVSWMQKMGDFINWKIGVGVAVGIVFLFIAYYTYKHYVDGMTNFHANRENVPKGDETVKTANMMLFYADWCPHCKTAKPEWEALKEEYEGKSINGYTLYFEEYNCTNESAENTQLMDKYSIEGYPTIKLLKDNQVIEYDAKPTKSTMEEFLNTML